MSKAQARMLEPGEKYRLGMYVATSKRKSTLAHFASCPVFPSGATWCVRASIAWLAVEAHAGCLVGYICDYWLVAAAIGQLKEWQEGEMGGEVKFTWRFSIPKGCRQATKIANVSHYADENEVRRSRDCPRSLHLHLICISFFLRQLDYTVLLYCCTVVVHLQP